MYIFIIYVHKIKCSGGLRKWDEQNRGDSVRESTKDEIIEYLKNVYDECNFKGKSENNLKVHLKLC